ncbi:MAG: Gfo/Idh/MocA family oxidoreductase [Gemmataceae bacterium]|nr:Gfo/Idh/MocA family oxidoreductase [Gemmataceae bacterium]
MPSRRTFLKATAATAGTLAALPQVHAGGSDWLKVGLVGCGGRGSGAIEQALGADPYAKVWALADVFPERADACHAKLKAKFADRTDITADRIFGGLDGYKSLIDSGVDVVLLCTTPAFRPAQLRYAVQKKKHIFCEKPMAVDAPGVRHVLETARMAKEANLNLVSGFCYRYDLPKRATIAKIHEGAIGDVLAIHTTYLTGYLWNFERQPGWSDTEYQLRNWMYYTWLSGDHIVEQHIHSLDKAAWVLKDAHPLNAISVAGRQTRVEEKWGNIYDHFATVYEFPGNVKVFSFCRQISGCANDVNDHVIGSKGSAQLQKHTIEPTGGPKWSYSGESPNMYDQEHLELFQAIRSGKTINQGEQMAYSTMLGILGRMAGYTGKKITWDQAMNSQEDLMPKNLDLKASLPFPPVAKPGRTKFE